MSKQLTFEQELALNLNYNISLNANAGSGKTSVLVERYFRIIEAILREEKGFENLTPDNIVAITFTNMAAAEMLSRVVAKFNETYGSVLFPKKGTANIKLPINYLEKVRTFRDKLTNAKIMTIHSFCLSIISKYPIESQIPVNFREISSSESSKFFEEAFYTAIDKWFNDDIKQGLLRKIFSFVEINQVKELASKLVSNLYLIDYLEQIYSEDFESYLQRTISTFKRLYSRVFHHLSAELNELLENYKDFMKFNNIRPDYIGKQEYLSRLEFSDFLIFLDSRFWDLVLEDLNKIFTKNFKPRKYIRKSFDNVLYDALLTFSQNASYSFRSIKKIKEYIELRQKLVQALNVDQIEFERNYFEISKLMFEFIKDVCDEFQVLKFNSNYIDFNDMLLKTYHLLRNYPKILESIRNEIKFLLVDEFQDTDELQYEIIKLFVPSLRKDFAIDSPNLFIVGDAKQSIYAFRNANVKIFYEYAKEDIRRSNSNRNIPSVLNGGILNLTSTFRTNPRIAAFLDYVFQKIFSKSPYYPAPETVIDYVPFTVPKFKLDLYDKVNSDVANVQFIFYETKDKGDEDDADEFEEKDEYISPQTEEKEFDPLGVLVANHIRAMIGNKEYLIFDKNLNSFRTIEFSDIAVISRKKNELVKLVPIFSSKGIPFIFQGGSFFETQEVEEVLAFLQFLLNPKNDVALATILKSPFFGFKDETLFNIAAFDQRRNLSFWEKLNNYYKSLKKQEAENFNENDVTFEDKILLDDVVEKLSKLLENFSIFSINELIQKILIETNWYNSISKYQNRDQILANIDELLDYSREFIYTGFRTIWDFVDSIELMKKYGTSDSEHLGFVSSNAVKLLTVHAAKGLEFPVVYAYRLDAQTRSPDQIGVTKSLGFVFNMDLEINLPENPSEIYTVPNFCSLIANEDALIEADAEERRILYVCLTRAIDYLIIAGKVKIKKDKEEGTEFVVSNNLLDEIIKCLTFFAHNHIHIYTFPLRVIDTNNQDNEIVEIDIKVPVYYHFDKIAISEPVVESDSSQVVGIVSLDNFKILDKVHSSISGKIISPTQLNYFESDPLKYLKTYFLGLPEYIDKMTRSIYIEDTEPPDSVIVPTLVGTAVHYCMEKIDTWFKDGVIDSNKIFETIDEYLYLNERLIALEVKNDVLTQCINVVQTQLFQRDKDNIVKSPKEMKLIIPFAENFIIGKIDLLYRKDGSEVEIWDWKTNNIQTREEMFELGSIYKNQMQTYALLISKLYPAQPAIAAKLMFTRLARPNICDEDWIYKVEFSRQQLEQFEKELVVQIDKLNRLEFEIS